jgi:hypothetical protein
MIARIRVFVKIAFGEGVSCWGSIVVRGEYVVFSYWGSAVGRVVASCE